MCKLDKCCCCIDLRVGAIVIAILEIIGGLCNFGNMQGNVWGSVICAIASILAGLCLLFGAIKYNQVAVIVNLVFSMIAIVFYAIVAIMVFIAAGLYGSQRGAQPEAVGAVIVAGVVIVIAILLMIYFWICVFSFLKGLKAGDIASPA